MAAHVSSLVDAPGPTVEWCSSALDPQAARSHVADGVGGRAGAPALAPAVAC